MKIYYISDADWIGALREGDLQAFGTLFDRNGKRLYHFSLGYLKSAEQILINQLEQNPGY